MLVAPLDHKKMPVLDTGNEFHFIGTELTVEHLDQLTPLGSSEMSAMMVHYIPFRRKGKQVATQGKIIRFHLIAYARGLKRATSFVHPVQIISEYRRIGYLASGRETFGHGDEHSRPSLSRHAVKGWSRRILEWSPPTQGIDRMIAHPVTKYYEVLHSLISYWK